MILATVYSPVLPQTFRKIYWKNIVKW